MQLRYPIHCAALSGNTELLRWLIDTHKCPYQDYILPSSSQVLNKNQHGHRNSDSGIVSSPTRLLPTSNGRTILDIAVENNHVDILQYLVKEKKIVSSSKVVSGSTLKETENNENNETNNINHTHCNDPRMCMKEKELYTTEKTLDNTVNSAPSNKDDNLSGIVGNILVVYGNLCSFLMNSINHPSSSHDKETTSKNSKSLVQKSMSNSKEIKLTSRRSFTSISTSKKVVNKAIKHSRSKVSNNNTTQSSCTPSFLKTQVKFIGKSSNVGSYNSRHVTRSRSYTSGVRSIGHHRTMSKDSRVPKLRVQSSFTERVSDPTL